MTCPRTFAASRGLFLCLHFSRYGGADIARFVYGNIGVIARTVTQLAPTATTVTQLFSVTQAKGLAMPIVWIANVTNASISYRLAVLKQTTATAAVHYLASDATMASATPAYPFPIADLESGDSIYVRTNTANGVNFSLTAYEMA